MYKKQNHNQKKEHHQVQTNDSKKTVVGIILLLAALIAFLLVNNKVNLISQNSIDQTKNLISSFGPVAPIVYICIMALAIIISPIPSLPLDAMAGAMWGPLLGTLYSLIGAEIGAIIAFLIARYIGKDAIERILHKDITFCKQCSENHLTWFILGMRLLPIFQFDIVSYGAGLTNISLKRFAIATFIGMIPATFLFSYFGESIILGSTFSVILTSVIVAGFFIAPIIIKKYNLFNLKDKM